MESISYKSLAVKTFEGLEEVLAKEIEELGGEDIKVGRRVVNFSGSKELVYKANLHLRTALRVLINVHQFTANTDLMLYEKTKEIEWLEIISPEMTFAIDSVVSDSNIFRHSNYASLKVKDAIVDQIRERVGIRPNVDSENPDVRINVLIKGEQCMLSLDTSGTSLHRRGYRAAGGLAPLNEILAAGMIMMTGWKGETPFFNPMCGSGTLLIEAAMIAKNIAPGLRRKFGFMTWKNFDRQLWKEIKKAAKLQIKENAPKIFGCDNEINQVNISEWNIEASKIKDTIEIVHKDFFTMLNKPKENYMMVINPPYDVRLEDDDIYDFYEMIGDTMKQRYTGSDAWIISANFDAIKNIGLRYDTSTTLFNGPLKCSYRKYSLFDTPPQREYSGDDRY
jgi:putative N6-adenine-specific DNA methylase